MKKTNLLLLFALSLFAFSANAQSRQFEEKDSSRNFYDIKKEFEEYWKDKEPFPGSGYKQFKRWAHFMEPRVYPSGVISNAGTKRSYLEFQNYLNSNPTAKQMGTAAPSATTANWTALGPFGNATTGNYGAGRLQCIRFHPAGTGTVYVGAAAGGLWKTTNNGTTWSTTTDNIASLGVSDIAIDPINSNIMYIATGDFPGAQAFWGGDSKSIGVMKSTDGGNTWNITGLNWTTSQQRHISRLLINPLNPVELFAFSSVGIYRTRDSGANWTLVMPGAFKDGEYKPGDTTTIYSSTGFSIQRSTNGGQSFVGTTFSGSGLSNIRLAVTPADPNYLYVVGSTTGGTFGRLVRSTNSATTFTTMSTTPNILGGNQGWYDLTVAVSPTNKDEVIVGGIDLWRSFNGGTSWTQLTSAYGAGPPYIHADQHDVVYRSGTEIWAGHDGGVSRSTNSGSSWAYINGNMAIAEPYFIGVSATNATKIVAGLQDNGSIVYNGTSWTLGKLADGMDCFVDWNNPNVVVASSQNGGHGKSTNGGLSFFNIQTGLTPSTTASWVAPIIQDLTNPNIFYAGRQDVFKSTNQGTSWSQLGSLGGSGTVELITACASNSNVIYAARATTLFKTTDGGATWVNITAGIPVGSAQLSDIDVDNTNANRVYVTLSGYSAGNKIFYSTDGGASWTNYSAGLPNLPANCVVFKKNSPGAIYVGMDYGVYYRELSMSAFVPYMTSLPNVFVNDLEIFYPTGKLRAATFGRGIWETDLYSQPGVAPTAYFSTTSNTICVGSSLAFSDGSSNSPTSWSWNFPGGSPGTSAAQTPPSITYGAAGVYTVSLVATNSVGASAPFTGTVYVINTPTSVPTNTGTCAGAPNSLTVTTNAANAIWQGGQLGFTASFAPTVTTVYSYTVFTGACQSTGTATMVIGPAPSTPTFTQLGNILTSSSAPGYQWYLNGSPIIGATSQTLDISATGDGFYSVWVDNGMGCQTSSTVLYLTVTKVSQLSMFSGVEISPNPAYEVLNIDFKNSPEKEITFTVINSIGQTIKSGKIRPGTTEKTSVPLENMTNGMYTLTLFSGHSSVSYKFIKQ